MFKKANVTVGVVGRWSRHFVRASRHLDRMKPMSTAKEQIDHAIFSCFSCLFMSSTRHDNLGLGGCMCRNCQGRAHQLQTRARTIANEAKIPRLQYAVNRGNHATFQAEMAPAGNLDAEC